MNTDRRVFISLSASARLLEVARQTAIQIIHAEGVAIERIGKNPCFSRTDIEQLLERKRHASTVPPAVDAA
jgi:hypothetical protein